MGQAEGEKRFSRNVAGQIRKIATRAKSIYLTGYPMRKWYKGRFETFRILELIKLTKESMGANFLELTGLDHGNTNVKI